MPKKGSEMPPAVQEEPVSVQKKPKEKPKKQGHEIDEIFSNKKRKKLEQEQTEEPKEAVTAKQKKMKKKKSKVPKADGFTDPPSHPRKRTEDGLVIYTEEELGIEKSEAGGTPLCPFDCSCCF